MFDESNQCFGAEKIRIVLRENGIITSKRRITAIMKELDLHSVRTDAKRYYQKQHEKGKKDLVKRDFAAKSVNQIWVSDITYFKLNDSTVCLCVIIDLFSRKAIAYRVGKSASKQLVSSTFRSAYQSRGNPSDLVFHSDRGSAYIANSFCKLLKQLGVKQSFSATGKPHDNAVAETFFATLKKEEVYRRNYKSERDFIKSIDTYMKFYNEMRPHRTLAYKTPAKFEELYG
ncbi:MAG: IS3 family transposase [Christensenella sp.]|nr:IS3 family transposase [Christensenella sp.]